MVSSVRDDALAAGLITRAEWDRGIADLNRTAEDGGTFHYTFFKAVAVSRRVPPPSARADAAGRPGQRASTGEPS
jgi:hypothetical protein